MNMRLVLIYELFYEETRNRYGNLYGLFHKGKRARPV